MDPQGRDGEKLHRVLRNFDPKTYCVSTAALFCKFGDLCNYGKKCRYSHRQPKENKRLRAKKDAQSIGGSSGSRSLDPTTLSQYSDTSSGSYSTTSTHRSEHRSTSSFMDSGDSTIRGAVPKSGTVRTFGDNHSNNSFPRFHHESISQHRVDNQSFSSSNDSRSLNGSFRYPTDDRSVVSENLPRHSNNSGNSYLNQQRQDTRSLGSRSSINSVSNNNNMMIHNIKNNNNVSTFDQSSAESGYSSIHSLAHFEDNTSSFVRNGLPIRSSAEKSSQTIMMREQSIIQPSSVKQELKQKQPAVTRKDRIAESIALVSEIFPFEFVLKVASLTPVESVEDKQMFCELVVDESRRMRNVSDESKTLPLMCKQCIHTTRLVKEAYDKKTVIQEFGEDLIVSNSNGGDQNSSPSQTKSKDIVRNLVSQASQ